MRFSFHNHVAHYSFLIGLCTVFVCGDTFANGAPCLQVSRAFFVAGSGSTPAGSYTAGETLDIRVTISYIDPLTPCAVNALGYTETVPAGWTYAGFGTADPLVQERRPDVRPPNGATGTLGFAYIAIPDLAAGAVFTYRIAAAAGSVDEQVFSGFAEYRLNAGSLTSEPVVSTIIDTHVQQTGALQMTLSPAGAVTAGAQWRCVGQTTWRNSGDTESGIAIGQATIEFKAISGWTTPANQTVNITNGGTATATGTYVQQTGALQVTLSPAGAVTAGAQWRRVGETTWRDTGETENGIAIGQATIEFKTIAGWTTPSNQIVNVTNGGTATATGTYVQQTGALQVTLSPAGAASAGAQWRRVGETTWRNGGDTESGIAVGQATIEFKAITGWTTPANQSVNITNGGTATATGTYVQQTGALQVTLSPAGAVTAGAQWRRVGETTWRNSGNTESGIEIGQTTIEFKAISGWTTPTNQSVNITNGGTATATGTYVQQTGALQVTLSPAGAVTAGAQWRRVGETTWRNSGDTESGIAVGQATIEFKTISGWTTPTNQSVNITNGGTATATGTYVQQTGGLQVNLSPADAVSAGAQWRRVGETTWRNSGDTESGIAVGQATIEFKTISGWTTPTNQSVNITNGGTATATGIYGQQTGALQVTLSPAGAVTAGAQWRRAGQPAWRNSGNTESGIAIGQATIEFKTISGWTAPSNQIVNITNGGTATATGIYGQQTGALQVTLSPAGAVTAGAQWRRAGQPAWRNSGETESSIPVGEYTLEFKDAAGWNTPSTQAINIVSGGTVTATGLYTQQAGSLRVTLAPEAAIAAGARWRRSGTTTWLSSGYTEGSIPAGQYRVEFKAVSQWMTPPGKTVNIVTGELVQATATYTQNDCVGDTIVLWMPDRTVHPGAEVLIPVNVNSAEVISPEGMEIHVTYDPAFLNTESISVQSTGITGKMCLLWNLPEEGRIVISAVGNLQGLRLSGQGHLFDIYGRLRDGLEEGACSTVRFEDVAFFDGEVRPLCLDATDTARLCAGATNRLGDINNDGANNVGDALFALRLAVHLEAREDRHITTGDMNGDNAIDSADALMLQRLSVLGFKSINPDMPDPGNGVSDPLLLSNILAAGIPITIKAEDEQGRVGEDVEIPVRVDNANGLCGYDINLTYPQDILTVKDVRPGTLVGTSPQRWRDDADNGLINISMGRQEAVYDQSKNAIPGTLATVVFTIKAKPATGDLATVRISGTPDLKGQYGDSFGWYTALFKDNGEIRVLPAAGSLQVTLAPQGAVNAGAQWQRVGQSAWRNSGATESNIPPGQVTVECSHVTGWDTPAQQDVTISSGQVATLTRTYVSSAGALQVTLAPQDAINAGAQWRRVGQSAWRNSGAAESGLAPGQYTVEFLTVTDWTTPAAQTISVVAGQTATLTGTYVYVEPAVTVQAQALLDGFGPADGDSNGSLSLGEARTVRPYLSDATFAALDANGDGGITQAELDAYLNPGPGGCDGCLGGKGAFPWADWKRFLGDLMLLGVSLAVLLAMGRGHAARR